MNGDSIYCAHAHYHIGGHKTEFLFFYILISTAVCIPAKMRVARYVAASWYDMKFARYTGEQVIDSVSWAMVLPLYEARHYKNYGSYIRGNYIT